MATDSEKTKRKWLWYIVGFAVPFLVTWGSAKLWTDDQTAMRSAGGVLQLLGVGLVVWGLRTAGVFTSWRAELRQRVKEWWGKIQKPHVVLVVNSATNKQTLESVDVRGGPGPEAPVVDRVAFLERELRHEVKRLDEENARLVERMDQERQQVLDKFGSLNAVLDDVTREVRDLPRRGAEVALAGAWWLLWGIIAQTWL